MISGVVSDFRQDLQPGSRVYILRAKGVDMQNKRVDSTSSSERIGLEKGSDISREFVLSGLRVNRNRGGAGRCR